MTTIVIDQERLASIVALKHGVHKPNDTDMCIMEAVAWVTHKEWSDHPPCVCPVISTFLRTWNDALPNDEDRTRLLKPLIPKLINTKGDATLESRRATMAADWLIRMHTPAWLRLAGLSADADALASLPEITDFAQYPALMPALEAARKNGDAARDAARDAAGAAAGDAAGDAAWAAARDAAGDAAGAAAWAAARDAARDAAGAAAGAAAWTKLKPTQEELQKSAVTLVERMMAA